MQKNYKEIEKLVLKYSFEKLKVSKEPEKLLKLLHKNNPEMIINAQNLGLLAAAIIYVYLKMNSLNGRGGITAKAVGLYFGIKASAITQKVFDVEFYIDNNKEEMLNNDPYEISEYIDMDRFEVNETYWNFLESPTSKDVKKSIKSLKDIIKKDPDYFDPYITLHEYYIADKDVEKAFKILSQGYYKAVALISDKNDEFPESLPWGFTENRHIIRILFNFATMLWLAGNKNEALAILLQLLKSNPNDNIGARYAILALLENYESYEHFEEEFLNETGEYLDWERQDDWFNKKVKKHPKVLSWWMELH
ncbi:hypothetical protein JHD50_01595 [Sulfurimonas sp. MAG313]|nr:hypothetical protein [Sulfurimonas sp. MAG313]MDF1880003.1 hypothetical protein [Sulfurimonas sp. MAG313]